MKKIRAGHRGPHLVGGERNGGGFGKRRRSIPNSACCTCRCEPVRDSTKRAGINLFTDSTSRSRSIRAGLKGTQQTHHDVWDYDSGNQPILFRHDRARAARQSAR